MVVLYYILLVQVSTVCPHNDIFNDFQQFFKPLVYILNLTPRLETARNVLPIRPSGRFICTIIVVHKKISNQKAPRLIGKPVV